MWPLRMLSNTMTCDCVHQECCHSNMTCLRANDQHVTCHLVCLLLRHRLSVAIHSYDRSSRNRKKPAGVHANAAARYNSRTSMHHEYCSLCDFCGKPADASVEDVRSITCTMNCYSEDGDLYHADCLKKFIGQGAKGTAKHLPNIPFSKFACPKGKGKGTAAEAPCKGLTTHCRRVIAKAEPKVAPQPVQLENGHKPPGKPPIKPWAPPKPAKPKAPLLTDYKRHVKPLAMMHTVPRKGDSLGRNLTGTAHHELPPGYAEEALAADDQPKQGKAAKKNQNRAARRNMKDSSQPEDGGLYDTWFLPPLEEIMGRNPSGTSGTSACAEDTEESVMSAGRFITDIAEYQTRLAQHLEESDVEDFGMPSGFNQAGCTATRDVQTPPWQEIDQHDASYVPTGWHDGSCRGGPTDVESTAVASYLPEAAAEQSGDLDMLRRREEELLQAALKASLEEDAVGMTHAAVDDEYDAALEQALLESQEEEEARLREEEQQQAALLAAHETRRRQHEEQDHHQQQAALLAAHEARWQQQQQNASAASADAAAAPASPTMPVAGAAASSHSVRDILHEAMTSSTPRSIPYSELGCYQHSQQQQQQKQYQQQPVMPSSDAPDTTERADAVAALMSQAQAPFALLQILKAGPAMSQPPAATQLAPAATIGTAATAAYKLMAALTPNAVFHAAAAQHPAPVQNPACHVAAVQHPAPVQNATYHVAAVQHPAPVQNTTYHVAAVQRTAATPWLQPATDRPVHVARPEASTPGTNTPSFMAVAGCNHDNGDDLESLLRLLIV